MVKEYNSVWAPRAKLLLLTWHQASSEVLDLGAASVRFRGMFFSAAIMNTIARKSRVILTTPFYFARFPCKKSPVSAGIPSVFSHLQVLGAQLPELANMLLLSERM